jgi:energy-coupling factor transport system permease protein
MVNLYVAGDSWLHRVDPRVKLLFVVSMIFLLVLIKNVWVMLAAAVWVHGLHISAATPLSRIRFIWKTLLPVILLMVLLRIVFYPLGDAWFSVWRIRITPTAVAQGCVLGLRIITLALVVFAWLYTTTQPQIVRGFVRLGVPHEWGMVLALALRYIPTFQRTFGRISEAQQARGLNLSQHKGIQRVRVMMPMFVAMIISSLRASGQLAMSMEARGYGRHGVARSVLHEIEFERRDYVLTILIVVVVLGITWLHLRYGFGRDPLSLFQPAS